MLRQRLVAAALGLPMLFVLLWLNWFLRAETSPTFLPWLQRIKYDDLPLLAIALIIAGASGWEVSQVVRHRYPHTAKWNGVYAATILIFLVHAIRLASPGTGRPSVPVSSVGLLIDSLGSTAAVMLLFLAVWSDIEQRGREGMLENLYVLLGGLYLGVTLSTLILLGQTPPHEMAIVLLFVLVFGNDTAAYFGGKQFHGPKLAPAVSPKKTVSGALCGLLATVVLAIMFKLLLMPHTAVPFSALPFWRTLGILSWAQIIVLALGIGIFGDIGDLLESFFKRWGGVKDAGSVIPGHGGFLDRFDSLFLAAPVCYLLIAYFFHFLVF